MGAHQDAATFYRRHLLTQPEPAGYLTARGLSRLLGPTEWTVGYAPPGWTRLTDHLRTQGYSDATLLTAGLALQTRYRTLIDRFRDRITFGLHDPEGRLVGFIGRAAPAAGPGVPKYLNTPATPVFDKRQVLFGLAEQTRQLAAGAVPVLVEGPLDALAIAHLDQTHAIVALSPCGTALTSRHAQVLRHATTSDRVVVAFDGDPAGQRAATLAYPLMAEAFAQSHTARLPAGTDPAELAVRDPDALVNGLSATAPLADLLVDHVLDHYTTKWDNAEARVCALHEVSRVVAGLHPTDVGRHVARISQRLDLPVATVTDDVAESVSHGPFEPRSHPQAPVIHRLPPPVRSGPAVVRP